MERRSERRTGSALLDAVERLGNALPDPAALFVLALAGVGLLSAAMDGTTFEVPARGGPAVREVQSQLTPNAIVAFLVEMVPTFTGFHPLGVVLVTLLGVSVAEQSGLVGAVLRRLLALTPARLLTPMVVFVALLSHAAADAGFVLVIPLGGVLFAAAGRHPLAGVCAAFAGVSGSFSANPLPSALDPLLQGITQEAAGLVDPGRAVNPLCNWAFMAGSSVLVVLAAWVVTDRVVEPRLARVAVDGDAAEGLGPPPPGETRGLWVGLSTLGAFAALVAAAAAPPTSPLRSPTGSLTEGDAPLMRAVVPLLFLGFLLPGLAHGFVAGTLRSHRDVVQAMTRTLGTMGHYLVMAFCASLFIRSFGQSQLGALLAVSGAGLLRALDVPTPALVLAIVVVSAMVNLVIGSASAKWALLAPVLVPLGMQLGLSPELVQGAYRIGDSTTNVITPLMPYFPLVVTFAQRHASGVGIGTLVALMLPYSLTFLVGWTLLLLGWWGLGVPLGVGASYVYP